eukprot:gb/GECG01005203.1/.p1 GENE.gb/GECG01005203.1/~~gb/GECG01005203.1/.p1  ORF type:complete len:377 (+),score=21.51 gb/GECG01005203.1/:1-1131(+)
MRRHIMLLTLGLVRLCTLEARARLMIPTSVSTKKENASMRSDQVLATRCFSFDNDICKSSEGGFSRVFGRATTTISNKNDAAITKVLLFGERRSGTNFFTSLIKNSFEVDVMSLNKHWPYTPDRSRGFDSDPPSVLVVIVVKDLYAWLRSLYKRPYHITPSSSFGDFLTKPYASYHEGKEIFDRPSRWSYDSVVEMRSRKYKSYLQTAHIFPHVALLSYESALANVSRAIEYLQTHFRMKTRTKQAMVVPPSVKKFYLNEVYMAYFRQIHLNIIRGLVDNGFEEELGYQIRSESVGTTTIRNRRVVYKCEVSKSRLGRLVRQHRLYASNLLARLRDIGIGGFCPPWQQQKETIEFACDAVGREIPMIGVSRFGHCC